MASAKQIRDEIMRMTIVVNSNPAQQEIYKLSEANRKFALESTKLREERTKVGQTLGKNSQEYKDLTDKINTNSSSITANKGKMKELSDTLDISQMSVKQLKQEAILLRRELDRVVPSSNQYKALQDQLGKVNGRLAEVRGGASAAGSSFSKLATEFNHYSGLITAGIAIFVGLGLSVKAVIDRNNAMADAMTAVEKTTGLARSEVEELTRTFSDFDTRTKKVDLLKMAEVGGRLGVAKGEIKDFTNEVDKAFVALGDSWKGTVEDLANSLGKTAKLFPETKDLPIATAINQIGSALNELAASGASSEQNISDFVLRMGRTPEQLRPPLNTLLGYGSAFEELGINAEIGASGFSKFLRVAAGNVKGFAAIMNEPVADLKQLINSDPAAFFLKFSEGLKGLKADEVATILNKLKLSDNEVQGAVGAAASNADLFRTSVDKAAKSVKEATSLQNEFNKVNNNSAAVWEKTQRKIMESLTSQSVAKYINSLVLVFGKFIGAIADSDGTITGFRNGLIFLVKILTLVMATTLSYNILTGVYNGLMKTAFERVIGLTIVEKARNLIVSAGNAIASLYRATLWLVAAGYSAVTKDTVGATFAMQGFNAAIKVNPIGLFITLIIAALTAVQLFSSETDNAVDSQKNLNKVVQEGVRNAAEEVGKLDQLYRAATNVALGKDAQRRAAEEMQKLYPAMFANIDQEVIMNGKARGSYLQLRDAIISASRAKAAQAQIDKINADYLQKEEEIKQKMLEAAKSSLSAGGSNTVNAGSTGAVVVVQSSTENRQIAKNQFKSKTEDLKQLYIERNKELDPYLKYVGKETQKANAGGVDSKSNYTIPGDGEDNPENNKKKLAREQKAKDSAEKRHDKEMDDMRKLGEQSKELARQIALDIEDAKIEAMSEGYDKELAALNLQEQRKMAEIDKKKVSKYELDSIDKQITKATGNDKVFFESLKTSWVKNNAELEKVKEGQKILFAQKRKTLTYKNETEELKNKDEAFQTELKHLERDKNEELAKYQSLDELKASLRGRLNDAEIEEIKSWNDGKEALNKVYQKKEIAMQVAHMQTMLALYEGLDLSILTKEQQDNVLKFIDDAKNKISELKAVQNGTEQKGKDSKKDKSKLGSRGSTDVLGMSPTDWDNLFTNVQAGTDSLGTMIAAVQAVQSAFQTYYGYIQAQEQRQVNEVDKTAKRKEDRLKKMLGRGQINQEQYELEIQKLNNETAQQKAKLEYESAKRKRAMDIANVITNTAVAIMGIWKDFPKFDFGATAAIMSGVIGALGLTQIATIASTPLPSATGYEDGFGMEYDMKRAQDGKQFRVKRQPLKSGLVNRPTHFLAGENGVEMVIDSPTYTRFRPEVKRMLHDEISYSRGYENGLYPGNNGSGNEDKYMQIIQQNTAAMNSILNKKFTANVGKTMDNAKEIINMTDEYSGYKNSAKK